jgi:outer membrane protein assembly factor BamD (BamD/ComL family)
LKLKADFLFARGDMDLAQDEYAQLTKQFPSGRYTQMAMLRSAESAEASFPGILFDDQALIDAEERYRQFETTFPTYAEREDVGERLVGIRQQRAGKDFAIADWYARTGQPAAAEFYYKLVLRDWPGTLAADEARTRLQVLGVESPDTVPVPEERK